MAAEDARRSPAGCFSAIAAMSRPSWKPGTAPRHPDHPVAEALAGQRLAVGGGGQRDAGVGVQVVDVRARRPGRAWRCRSTARRRPGRAGSSRTRRPSRPRARRRGRRRPARAAGPAAARPGPASVSVPRSPPEPLTHSSSTGCAGDRVGLACPWRRCCRRRSWCCAGRRRAGCSEQARRRVRHVGPRGCVTLVRASRRSTSVQAPQPACWPPTRSAAIRSCVAGARRRRRTGRGRGPADSRSSREQRPDVGVVGVHQHGVRAEHVTGVLGRGAARRGRRAAPWPWPPARSSPSGSGRGSSARCCGTGRA